jgi:ribosome biogenesis GTPase / thiamine phosphate phosphatase
MLQGRVMRSTGALYDVLLNNGQRLTCTLKGNFRTRGLKATNPVAVGDLVELDHDASSRQGSIKTILPRTNYIIRKATKLSKNWHIIAANLDRAYLIATLAQPRTSTGFIDRFLVTAEAYSIPASIIFNKKDLWSDEEQERFLELNSIYGNAGYPCLAVSALSGEGIDALYEDLDEKISLFSGHSGVGKSALINTLNPNLRIKVGALSDYWDKGKHTTTFAEMHQLRANSFIIDTPGIREFGILDFGSGELVHFFPELFALLPECRFYNCTHDHEPGCALEKAITEGRVSLERYGNYLKMLHGEDMDIMDWEI